jgi:hypothetical protein
MQVGIKCIKGGKMHGHYCRISLFLYVIKREQAKMIKKFCSCTLRYVSLKMTVYFKSRRVLRMGLFLKSRKPRALLSLFFPYYIGLWWGTTLDAKWPLGRPISGQGGNNKVQLSTKCISVSKGHVLWWRMVLAMLGLRLLLPDNYVIRTYLAGWLVTKLARQEITRISWDLEVHCLSIT